MKTAVKWENKTTPKILKTEDQAPVTKTITKAKENSPRKRRAVASISHLQLWSNGVMPWKKLSMLPGLEMSLLASSSSIQSFWLLSIINNLIGSPFLVLLPTSSLPSFSPQKWSLNFLGQVSGSMLRTDSTISMELLCALVYSNYSLRRRAQVYRYFVHSDC